ncbi:MAG: hypothetical protein GQ574_14980 [Crocinitomix sp.]|nr:hypothetical protein [Crocinitomix sp.]
MKSPKVIVALLLLFISPFTIQAQTFTNIYGGDHVDRGKAVCTTHDGGIIVAGSTYSFDSEGLDIYVAKFDTTGDTLWSIYIGRDTTDFEGFHREESVAVLENSANEIIVCGTYHITGWSDYHGTILHRISADGDILQSRLSKLWRQMIW